VTTAVLMEGNAQYAYLSCCMCAPAWLEPDIAARAAASLISSRGPFRSVWLLIESDIGAQSVVNPPAAD